jgi:hypothetical protein
MCTRVSICINNNSEKNVFYLRMKKKIVKTNKLPYNPHILKYEETKLRDVSSSFYLT